MTEVYDSDREQAINLYLQLQELKNEGKDVSELKEDTLQKILGFVTEDAKERLERLREELKEYKEVKKE